MDNLGSTTTDSGGAKAGELVDEHVLNNYRCLACGYEFSK